MNDLSSTGAITTQDLAPTGNAPTNGSFVQLPTVESAIVSRFVAFEPDVSWVMVEVSGTYTGALNVNGTVDGVTWSVLGDYPFVNQNTGLQTETIPSGATGLWAVNVVGLQAIRIDAPGAVTGTANVSLNASKSAVAPRGPSNPLSTGAQTASLAASVSDQVASAIPGRLVSVTILTSGSAATSIYDNATAGSGKLIAIIPANPTVGQVYTFQEPVTAGITVKGAANTSGLLVDFD